MHKVVTTFAGPLRRWRLSLFEKVILVNSLMLIVEALMGLWVTSHNLESQHYLIDTLFIVLATLLTLLTNIFLLRMSFRPLFALLSTIREVSAGKTDARAALTASDHEITELAHAFNSMLDRLEVARHTQTSLILQAQEEERRRVGLELHDEAGQNLTALLIHTEILCQQIQALPPSSMDEIALKQMRDGLQQLTSLAQYSLETIRILAQQLRPSVLEDLGLLAALHWLVEDSQQRLHLVVTLRIEGIEQGDCPLPTPYEITLFRIAQESLTNIARHAHTPRASITLQANSSRISLCIHDDGRGYDIHAGRTGSGIIGMRERAALLKGTLDLHSQPGQGTTVQVTLPLPQEHMNLALDRGEKQ